MTTTPIDPVEIDTQIAEFNDVINGAFKQIQQAANTARMMLGERRVRIGRSMGYLSTDHQALDKLRATTFAMGMDVDQQARVLDAVAAAEETIREATEQRAPLDAIYEAHRWNRYSEVVGGHIHQGAYCAGGTIRPTTEVTWRVDLSGTTIEHAVTELGPLLCSHCYPSAPVEWRRSAADLKAEAEAASGTYCDSYDLTDAQRNAINWRRRSNYVVCHACGNQSVPVTSTGRKRKHKRPAE